MTLGEHMNVVAILRSDVAGQALNAACSDINGTEMNQGFCRDCAGSSQGRTSQCYREYRAKRNMKPPIPWR